MVQRVQVAIHTKSDIANSLLTHGRKDRVSRLLKAGRAQSRDAVARQDRNRSRHDRVIRRQHINRLLEEERRADREGLGTYQQRCR